jgi:hypothetical protein
VRSSDHSPVAHLVQFNAVISLTELDTLSRLFSSWDNRSSKVRTEVLHSMCGGMLYQMLGPEEPEAARNLRRGALTADQDTLVRALEGLQANSTLCRDQKNFPRHLEETLTNSPGIAKVSFRPRAVCYCGQLVSWQVGTPPSKHATIVYEIPGVRYNPHNTCRLRPTPSRFGWKSCASMKSDSHRKTCLRCQRLLH